MDESAWIKILHLCECGYKRPITDTANWRQQLILHPLYGKITQYSAALLDIQLHNCYEHHMATRRSPRANDPVMIDYGRKAGDPHAKMALGYPRSHRNRIGSGTN